SGEWQDWLVDDSQSQEQTLIEQDELDNRRGMLADAMAVLNERERRIFEARRLSDDPMTLEDLSGEFGISRERVRQIEVRAFEKVQDAVKAAARRQAQALRTIEAEPACAGFCPRSFVGDDLDPLAGRHAPADALGGDQAEPLELALDAAQSAGPARSIRAASVATVSPGRAVATLICSGFIASRSPGVSARKLSRTVLPTRSSASLAAGAAVKRR